MDALLLGAIISGMKIAADNKITKELLKEIVSAGLDLSEDQGKELLEKYKKNFNLNLSLLPVPLKKTEAVREAITDFLIHYTDLDTLVLRCEGKTDAVADVLVQDFEDTYEGDPDNLKYAKPVLRNLAKKTVASVEEATVQEVNFLTAYMDRLADENRESHERMEKTLGRVQSTLGEIKDTVNEIAGQKRQEEKQDLHNLTLPPSMVDGATFVRTSDVNQVLHAINEKKNLLLVNGFGGVGKTSVAKALFHKVKDSYHYVGWIEYERSLKESLLSTVRLYDEETDPDMRLDKILAFFAEHGKEIFLVIDNVDRADDELLSRITGMGMTLLLTSRLSNIPSYQEHPIGFLNLDGGVKLFYGHCKRIKANEHLDTVKKLVKMVQRHTLSIELIAKGYTASYGSLEKYHQALVEKGMTYPKLEINAGNEHVAATIAGHLKKLFDMQKLTEGQKRILYNLSYMPNRNLPGAVCGWIQADENEMHRLAETGWIEEGDGTYYMHPIVRETVLLDEAVYPADVGKEFLTCIDEKRFFSQKDHYTVSWEKLDLAEAFVGHMTEERMKKYANVYFYIAWYQYRYGRYVKALAYFEKSLEIWLELYGEKHGDVATSYNNIGYIHRVQGNLKKALEYYEKSLEISLELYGEKHGAVAGSYNNIGLIHDVQGDPKKALEYYEKSLEILLELYGEKHGDVATSYNNIGHIYDNQGNLEKALEYYEKSLEIRLELYGEKHGDVATSYNNIGYIYDNQGNPKKALEYYEKSLEIRLELYGEKHGDVATSYNNIGTIYDNQGNPKKALEYYGRSLEIRLELYGEKHGDVATSYNNIGYIYYNQGNHKKALEYYEKSLEIRLELYGEKHGDVATSYKNIGIIYDDQGNHKKALEYYEKSLEIRLELYGEKHGDVARSYNNIGTIYYNQGNHKKALEYYEKSLGIRLELYGEKHGDVARSYNNIGYIYDNQGNLEKALKYYEKSLEICLELYGEKHGDVALSYNNIGIIYYNQGDYKKALEYLEKAYEIWNDIHGPEHPDTKDALLSIQIVKEKLSQQTAQ